MQSEGFFVLFLLPEKLIYFERLKFLKFRISISVLKCKLEKFCFYFQLLCSFSPRWSWKSDGERESRDEIYVDVFELKKKTNLQYQKLVENYYECIIHVRQFWKWHKNVSKDFDERALISNFLHPISSHKPTLHNATQQTTRSIRIAANRYFATIKTIDTNFWCRSCSRRFIVEIVDVEHQWNNEINDEEFFTTQPRTVLNNVWCWTIFLWFMIYVQDVIFWWTRFSFNAFSFCHTDVFQKRTRS